MKKITVILLLTAIMQQVIGQTETFDIATYSLPKSWKKLSKPGVVIYTTTDESKGAYCMIALYESTVSTGKPAQDFTDEWNDLAVGIYGAAPAPKTETQTSPDGWKMVAGAAPVVQDSVSSIIVLTVISGFGKKMSVLSNLNDQSYLTTIDSLLQNIKLDKNATAVTTSTNILSTTDTNEVKEQFGSVKYTKPTGWNITKYPDGDILAPSDLAKGEFLEIWIQPSMNFSGTMEQALQKSYDETVAKLQAKKMNEVNGGNYTALPAKTSFRGWDYIRCNGGIHMGGGDYPPEYGLDVFIIKINGRYEQIAIIKSKNNCNLSAYYPSQRLSYYNDIENFLFSLQFTDWKESVVNTGIAKGDGIAGVWQGISMSVGMAKPGAGLGAELKVKQLIFFSNGQAYFGTNFPVEGLDEFNTWVKAENNRRDWGTYTFINGKGVLKLPYGDILLRMENHKLIVTTNKTDHGFIKTNAVDGARFNGSYVLSKYNGKIPSITFTTDGKFTDNGAIRILYHEYNDCINPGIAPGAGRYDVKDYTITFNYTDGRKIKIAFMGTEYDIKNQSPAVLRMSNNEDPMTKL